MKLKDNNNIFCTVSAGYSSVMMALKIKEWYPNHNIIYAMANTSKERIESLEFMNECDKHYKLNINWIEAEFHEKGIGTTPKIVDYKDLKISGEIFENGIKKFGIPSKINKWCNRDLKIIPLKKFADGVFGLNNYSIAVGMRVDEIDRVGKNYKTNNTFYPLVDNNISTRDRNRFWKDQPIQIKIPAFKGNCDLCFEKSSRKLMTIIKQDPKTKKWWLDIEMKYRRIPIEGKPSYNYFAENINGMNFNRNNLSMIDLIKMSKKPFTQATDEYVYENDLFDLEGDCGSGCQVF